MRLIEELIAGGSGNDVPVGVLLRKVKVLASRARLIDLGEWVAHELGGYPDDGPVPDYRGPFHLEGFGNFSGPFGSGLQNAPIPAAALPDKLAWLYEHTFRESIDELERLAAGASGGENPVTNWPANVIGPINGMIRAGDVSIYPQLYLQQAWSTIPATVLSTIADTVRTRILDLALELEVVAPNAGSVEGPQPSTAAGQQIVTNVIGISGGMTNLAIASNDFAQTIHHHLPSVGEADELLAYLDELGVDAGLLDELRDALSDDDASNEGHRPSRVRAWLTRYMLHPAGAIGTGATGDLVARAVAAFLGIGS